jgi:hypothetical protein
VQRLTSEFPAVDFSTLDPVYPDKTSAAGSLYRYSRTGILNRAQLSLGKLYRRPEKVILVVSHSGFMRLGVAGRWWFNADYRIFDFGPMAYPDDLYTLQEHTLTSENGGGLGWSFKNEVILGSDLPDEMPSEA